MKQALISWPKIYFNTLHICIMYVYTYYYGQLPYTHRLECMQKLNINFPLSLVESERSRYIQEQKESYFFGTGFSRRPVLCVGAGQPGQAQPLFVSPRPGGKLREMTSSERRPGQERIVQGAIRNHSDFYTSPAWSPVVNVNVKIFYIKN